MYQDKKLSCRDCGEEFLFTVKEQEFYAEKGFTNEPGRCSTCRSVRKQRNNKSNNRNGGFAQRSERKLYSAICAECGVKTQVPFRPNNDKPVYCRECFNN